MGENYKKLCENRINTLNKHLKDKGIFTEDFHKLVMDVYCPDKKPFIKLCLIVNDKGGESNLTSNVFSYNDFYTVIRAFEQGLGFKKWCKMEFDLSYGIKCNDEIVAKFKEVADRDYSIDCLKEKFPNSKFMPINIEVR